MWRALKMVAPSLPRLSRRPVIARSASRRARTWRGAGWLDADAGFVGEGRAEAVRRLGEDHIHVDAALGGFLLEHLLELVVAVAEDTGAGKARRGSRRREWTRGILADLLGAFLRADQFAPAVIKREAVAVVEFDRAGGVEVAALRSAVQADHAAHRLAHELGRIEGADVGGRPLTK